MLTTPELLATLERSLVVEPELLAQLKRMYEKSPHDLMPRAAMKWLVDQGQLTAPQAERLLASAGGAAPSAPAAKPPADEDEFGLAPLDDEPSRKKVAPKPAKAPSPSAKPPVAAPRPAKASEPAKPQAAAPVKSAAPAKPVKPAEPPKPAEPELPAAKSSIDELFDDPALGRSGGMPLGAPSLHAVGKRAGGKRTAWDSPLMLVGGGSLLLLCIIGVVLVFSLGRQTGQQAFDLAEADYQNGSYVQAIQKYDRYLEKFPSHGRVSLARVHRGLARLRQTVDAASDWPGALKTAHEILNQIGREESFAQAGPELGSLLSTIAEGLAKQASNEPDPTRVEEARDALALVQKYVPASQQPVQRLTDTENLIGLAVRKLDQGKILDTTLASIRSLAGEGKMAEAYAARKKFLKTYPELAGDKTLRDVLVELSQTQRKAVRYSAEKRAAVTDEVKSSIVATATFAQRSGNAAAEGEGHVAFVLADGAAYGLDAASGRVLWRRFVGFDTTFVPQPVTAGAAGDAILADSVRNEVVRVEATTGKPRWRAEIGEPFRAPPAIFRQQVVVATSSGRMVKLDAASGEVVGAIEVPQPLVVRPATDSRERLYYQPADHSNLYVLSAGDGTCQEVFHLGHESGRVRAAPVVVGRYLLVAENRGAADGVLHVLKTDDKGLALESAQQHPYQGHVVTAPEVAGRSVFLATDHGAILVFEVATSDQAPPLAKVTEKLAEPESSVIRYLLARGGRLFVAGLGLTRYDVQTARGRLSPSWVRQEQSVGLAAPQLFGQKTLINARQRRDFPGVVVAAVRADDGQSIWETHLAAPLAGVITTEPGKKLVAVTELGATFPLDDAQLVRSSNSDSPKASLTVPSPLAAGAVSLPQGRWALSVAKPAESNLEQQVAILDTQDTVGEKLRWLPVPDAIANSPVAFRQGLLVPGRIGQVFHLDPVSGQTVIEPFQPRLESGVRFAWSRPLPLGDKEVLIADGRTKLYRLAVVDTPKPHFESIADTTLATPLVSPIAAAGETAYAVDFSGRLLSFGLPDLAPGKDWPFTGAVAWGPERVGNNVLVAADSGRVVCLDGKQQIVWDVELFPVPLAGATVAGDGQWLAASTSGKLALVDASSGKIVQSIDVQQPLMGTPMAWGKQWLLTGADGALHLVNPETDANK
jgi:outer membrane protein assembly factor BamB/TolA-binding protein